MEHMVDSEVSHRDEFGIDTLRLEDINQICRDCKTKFRDWDDFVSESMTLFILWWTKPDKALALNKKWFPHFTEEMKKVMKKEMGEKEYKAYVKEVEEYHTKNGFSMHPPDIEFVDKVYEPWSVDEIRLDLIDGIVDRERGLYPTLRKFFDGALDLSITFWQNPNHAMPKFAKLFPHLGHEQRELIKKYSMKAYTSLEQMSEKIVNDEKKNLDLIKKNEVSHPAEVVKEIVVAKKIQPVQSSASNEMQDVYDTATTTAVNLCAELDYTESAINDFSIEKKINKLSDAEIKNDVITGKLPYDSYPLVWSFYSRFFPVKVIISVLAEMMAKNNGEMVEYEPFRDRAYYVALGLSIEIKEYEAQWRRRRNDRISAGLPQPPVDDRYLSPTERNEKMNKFEASKERFKSHFIGMSEEAWNKKQKLTDEKIKKISKPIKNDSGVAFFEGAINAMGLANFVAEKKPGDSKYKIKVGLTPEGAEFYRKRNPVLKSFVDKRGNQQTALGPEESDFIRKKIISRFSLEETFVSTIEQELVGKEMTGAELDKPALSTATTNWLQIDEGTAKPRPEQKELHKKIEDLISIEKRDKEQHPWYSNIRTVRDDETIVTPWRVATMGRLTEMGIVNWEIESKTGSSKFTLKKHREEPPKITTN